MIILPAWFLPRSHLSSLDTGIMMTIVHSRLRKANLLCMGELIFCLFTVKLANAILYRDDLSRRAKLSLRWTAIARSIGAAPITFINEEDEEETPPLASGFRYIERGYV